MQSPKKAIMSIVRVPRVFDHHNHLSLYLLFACCPSLADVSTKEEAWQLLRSLPAREITIVVGWHSERYSIESSELEEFSPLVVVNFCLHGFRFNRAAAERMAAVGIVLSESSLRQEESLMPEILSFVGRSQNVDSSSAHWESERQEWERHGLYGMADMLSLCPAFASGDFQIERWEYPKRGGFTPSPGIAGLKLFADGAVGSRTAALSGGFRDGGCPILTHTDAEMEARLRHCYHLAPQVAVHTIGDQAIEQVLGAYERLKPQLAADGIESRLRLEHCQFITLEQAKRAKRLGVVLSMQPNFSDDSTLYSDRLSSAQARANNPLRMVIDGVGFVPGEDLLFGSDGMPVGLDWALQSALFPPYEEQRLSLEELLAGYRADERYGTVALSIDAEARRVSLA